MSITNVPLQQALDIAVQHHQAGRLAEAEQVYRQILARQPQHADALHLLGVIAQQVGQHDAAIELIGRAIAIAPSYAEAHSNLGNSLKEKGRLDDAIAAYERALALKPDHAESYCNLSVALTGRKRFEEAIAACRRAIALKPGFAEAHNNLANALKNTGQVDEAMAAYRQAIALKPDYAEAYSNLGLALRDKGQLDDAVGVFRRTIALNPKRSDAHFNLANALKEQGHRDEAIAAYRQAIVLTPSFAEAYSNMGASLAEARQFDEAIVAYRQAVALKPDYGDAYCNLGVALQSTGQVDEAIAAGQRAVALRPEFPEALSNLANALVDKGRCDEAIGLYHQALALKANYPEAYYNLGVALKKAGRVDEAVAACRRAIELNPNYPEAYNNLGVALTDKAQLDDAVAAYRQAMTLDPGYRIGQSNLVYTLNYHAGYSAEAIAREQRLWNRQHAEPLKGLIRPHENDRNPERRLKIGYVSPDFMDHPVGRVLWPLLAHHDKGQVEVFAYAQLRTPDALTERMRKQVDHWRSTVGASDEQVAEQIRADKIDVLIDMALHTAGNRLLVFARKPAPVQVTFAGYPGSTGLETIDYRLTDPYLDPPGMLDAFYSEESFRLPHSFWCFDPLTEEPVVGALPALKDGSVTFGCLNNFCKVNDGILALWAKVLVAVKDSRLVVLAKEGDHRPRAIAFLVRCGVAAERVEFRTPRPRPEYLSWYNGIDIGLDTLPYNGHTTSLDSFWMGVPVVTLIGQTVVGRAGLSQLTNLGLAELAGSTEEEFVRLAQGLAGDWPRLEALRTGLRQRMKDSPLMDAAGFARGIEAAYRAMWRRWCGGADKA